MKRQRMGSYLFLQLIKKLNHWCCHLHIIRTPYHTFEVNHSTAQKRDAANVDAPETMVVSTVLVLVQYIAVEVGQTPTLNLSDGQIRFS